MIGIIRGMGIRSSHDLKMIALAGCINEIFPKPGCHLFETNDPVETGVATLNSSGRDSAMPGNEPVEGSPITD
jgi:hypothetical protein